MVVQVFDLLQVTTLLKSVIFALFLSLMASRLSRYFKFVSFVSHREQAYRRTVADLFKNPYWLTDMDFEMKYTSL